MRNPMMLVKAQLIILLVVVAAAPATAATSVAGRVVYAYGDTLAVDSSGLERRLQRRDRIYSGDTLKTRAGRAQIKFSDGGFISLQSNSEFAVTDYKFESQKESEGSAIFSLIKGGFRAITGLIGRRDKSRYKVSSSVATIGIRGTAYYARLCQGDCFTPEGEPIADGLHASTGEGAIYVQNLSGSLDVPAGKAAYVQDQKTHPVSSTVVPRFAVKKQLQKKLKRQAQKEKNAAVAGEQYSASGSQSVIAGPNTNIGFTRSYGSALNQNGFFDLQRNRLFFNTAEGKFDNQSGNRIAINRGTLQSKNFFSNNTIAVGRWTGNGGRFLFSVNGGPFQPSAPFVGHQSLTFANGLHIKPLPASGQAFYKLIPGSALPSTTASGASIGAGLLSGRIGVDFLNAGVTVDNFRVGHFGTVFTINGTANLVTASDNTGLGAFFGAALTGGAFSATGPGCSPCVSEVQGQLHGSAVTALGNTPTHATAIYAIPHPADAIGGAAGFLIDANSIQ